MIVKLMRPKKPKPSLMAWPSLLLLAPGIILFLTGCGLSKPSPIIRSFALEAPGPDNIALIQTKGRPITIEITNVGVSSECESSKLVYKISRNEMVEDFYSQLTGLPARVTADETARWLEAYGGNIKTQRTSSLKNPDYALDLFLTSFHGDLSQSPSMAIMEMKMTLTKVAGPVVVIAKTYRAQRPFNFTSPELRPELLAQNLSLALGDILSQFLEDFKAN